MSDTGEWVNDGPAIYDGKGHIVAKCFESVHAEKIVRAVNCFDRFLVSAKALLEMTRYELDNCETMDQTAMLAQGYIDLENLIADAEGGGDE